MSGIFTGSVYKDFALLRNGFPGESVKNGRVLVVKTHESGLSARSQFQKAILLVRKPSEAILAEFNRRAAGHIGHAGRDKYTRNAGRCKYYIYAFNTPFTNIFTPTGAQRGSRPSCISLSL